MYSTTVISWPRRWSWSFDDYRDARCIFLSAALLVFGASPDQADAKVVSGIEQRRQCDKIYEPSGLTQLADGRIVVADDEDNQPLSIITLNDDLMVSTKRLSLGFPFPMTREHKTTRPPDDLEALALDGQGFVYAITSHSRTNSGKRSSAREQLLRFRVAGDKLDEMGVRVDLRKAMIRVDENLRAAAKVADVKVANGFSIEGLSFNQVTNELMIGLRSPIVDGRAVIIVLKNPLAAIEHHAVPNFADEPIYLALGGGGIRAMAFDPTLGGFLIVSRQNAKGEQIKLWLWSGDPDYAPRRVHIDSKYDLSNAEGIAPVRYKDTERIMIALDAGQKSKRNKGCYFFLSYDQLEVEPISK